MSSPWLAFAYSYPALFPPVAPVAPEAAEDEPEAAEVDPEDAEVDPEVEPAEAAALAAARASASEAPAFLAAIKVFWPICDKSALLAAVELVVDADVDTEVVTGLAAVIVKVGISSCSDVGSAAFAFRIAKSSSDILIPMFFKVC